MQIFNGDTSVSFAQGQYSIGSSLLEILNGVNVLD